MPTTCTISFDNPDGVYFAGEILRGTITLTVTRREKVRGVYVRVFGGAYTHWTRFCSTDHGRNRDEYGKRISSGGHHVSYSGSEVYLDEKTYFIGGRSAIDLLRLEPDTYIHMFQCSLPAVLPTSLTHANGHITYDAEIVLDIPDCPEKKFAANFSVVKRVDLNIDPMFRMPVTNEMEKTFYPFDSTLCCCSSGSLIIDAATKVKGYAPGQTINIKINVNNESNDHVHSLLVKFNKEITFQGVANEVGHHGEIELLYVDHVIEEETTRGFRPGEKGTIYVNFRIPAIPPTDSSNSSIIIVNYLIRITATIEDCCSTSTSLDLPITIGTIPIRDNFNVSELDSNLVISAQPISEQALTRAEIEEEAEIPMLMEEPAPTREEIERVPTALSYSPEPIFLGAPSAPSPPIDFSDNPPSYEEAMSMGTQSTHKFKPKYPMFRRPTSYSIGED